MLAQLGCVIIRLKERIEFIIIQVERDLFLNYIYNY